MKQLLFLVVILLIQTAKADSLQDCILNGRITNSTERANHNEACYRQHTGFLHGLFGDAINSEKLTYLNSVDQEEAVRLGLDAGLECLRGNPEQIREKIPQCITKNSFIQSSRNTNHYRCKLSNNEFIFAYMNDGEVSRLALVNTGSRSNILAYCSR